VFLRFFFVFSRLILCSYASFPHTSFYVLTLPFPFLTLDFVFLHLIVCSYASFSFSHAPFFFSHASFLVA
jgi:hypothetical protein